MTRSVAAIVAASAAPQANAVVVPAVVQVRPRADWAAAVAKLARAVRVDQAHALREVIPPAALAAPPLRQLEEANRECINVPTPKHSQAVLQYSAARRLHRLL